MKKLMIFICSVLFVPVLFAQFSGGNGRGDIVSGLFEFYLGNNFVVDGYWSTEGCWSLERLPYEIEKPKILANAVLNHDAIITLSGLTITNEGSLTIEPNGRISINGSLINHAALTLKTNDITNSSLIYMDGEVYATVRRYVSGPEFSWHLMSSPVQSQKIIGEYPSNFHEGSFIAWHEPAQTWVSHTNTSVWPTWNDVNDESDLLLPGKGYLVAYDYLSGNPQIKEFDGLLNIGTVTSTLQRKAHITDIYEGFNLIGNPYPSYIDWKAANGWTGREKLQQHDTLSGGYNMWIWNDVYGNYGAHNSGSQTDYTHLDVSRYIPPMQGFWVRANLDESEFAVTNIARVHQGKKWLKEESGFPGLISLAISNSANAYRDEVVIEYGHSNSLGGADKMFSLYETAPSLYAVKNNHKWSINFLTNIEEHPVIPLGFKAGIDAFYTLSAKETGQFDQVILRDLFTGTEHNLTLQPDYHFSAQAGDPENRFLLQFNITGIDKQEVLHPEIYYDKELLTVINTLNENAEVRIFDLNGRQITAFEAIKGKNQYRLKILPGIYIISLYYSYSKTSQKLFIY